ncbi:MAG: hypothetical protein NZ853_04945 [Leptospiraceae bacterium]|nr:hypothetical protein [Leptospiraceae bacterium]MDW7976706.1 hypothetical protein [Leptospiraceae bacterium]
MQNLYIKNIFIVFVLIFTILFSLILLNLFSFFACTKPLNKTLWLTKENGFSYFPYDNPNQQKWFKATFHMHSESLLHYERHSIESLYKVYREFGFDVISVSDYNHIFYPDFLGHEVESYIPVYEWGLNNKKQHFLSIQASFVVPDLFPFFRSLENLQWSISQIRRGSTFVVLNHPKLLNGFTADMIVDLEGFQAMEVFTPFGDSLDLWDEVLSKGKPVFSFSSDDLHVFSKEIIDTYLNESLFKTLWREWLFFNEDYGSEALKRYLLIEAPTPKKEDILRSLCKGRYVAVKQNFPETSFAFPLKEIISNENVFSITFKEPVQKISFKTKHNQTIIEFHNQQHGKINLKGLNYEFIRIEVFDLRGILITNPVFRLNKEIPNFCEVQ